MARVDKVTSAVQASARQRVIQLGLESLIDFGGGYIPSRPELDLIEKARRAVKRLSLTLDQRERNGYRGETSIPKAIVRLCESLADSAD